MFRRIMLTVLLAGGLAGTVSFGLQTWKLFPLILEAEVYEESAAAHGHPGMAHERAVHDGAALERYAAESEEWTPGNGMERISYSLLADLLTSIGFAALLVGAIALSGREVGSREGLLWGLAGFGVFSVAPTLGLPPELPGMMAADLTARQIWWVGTAGASAAAIALVVFARPSWLKATGGGGLAVLPHAIGAPQALVGGVVPPELLAHFTIASMAIAAVFWMVLGGLAGTFYQHLNRQPGKHVG